jgi:hypothetical protein
MPSEDLIKEFQLAIQKDYGKDVMIEEAGSILRDLVQYFSTLEKVYNSMKRESEVI